MVNYTIGSRPTCSCTIVFQWEIGPVTLRWTLYYIFYESKFNIFRERNVYAHDIFKGPVIILLRKTFRFESQSGSITLQFKF